MICKLTFKDGRTAEVVLTVKEEPRFPTPGEPDIIRDPLASEWTELLGRLIRMDFDLVPISTIPLATAAKN